MKPLKTTLDYEQHMLKTVTFMLETIPIQRILIIGNDLDKVKRVHLGGVLSNDRIIWATEKIEVEEWLLDNGIQCLHFPHKHDNPLAHLGYYVVSAVTRGLMAPKDVVLCLASRNGKASLNQLYLFKPIEDFEIIRLIDWHNVNSQFDPNVLLAAVDLALAMGSVRHAYVRGTMITIGDTVKVLEISKPFLFDPFPFYEKKKRNITDLSIRGTFEKYTRLDGAFIISWDGTIESVVQTINAPVSSKDVPKGLGSRHTAAGAISLYTAAYVIVVSQSAGNVSVFKNGKIVLSLKSY